MSYKLQHSNIPQSLQDRKIFNPTQYRFCLDNRLLSPDQSYVSQNQKLVGMPNPKTLQPTVIVPSPAATDFWMDNNVVPSGINDESTQYVSQSGYIPDTPFYWDRQATSNVCCGGDEVSIADSSPKQIEGYTHSKSIVQKSCSGNNCYYQEQFKQPEADEWRKSQCNSGPMACNGDPSMYKDNADSNIPINRVVGQCEQSESMKPYNKELYTSTIEPGIYTRSSVVEPTNYNIGISHTEQFEPLSLKKEGDGLLFQQHPHSMKVEGHKQSSENYPNTFNVYDPRFTGYGTSYRSYTNQLLGQPDYFYDDVDAIRRPNFLIKSNIDHNQWANQYGPMDTTKGGCIPYAEANQQFMVDTATHRIELQERLLRKYNTKVGWQRRNAPLSRASGANFTYR